MDKKRFFKRAGVGALLLVPLVFVSTPIGVGLSLTHPKRKQSEQTPDEYGMNYEVVNFTSSLDGVKLSGWWVPSKTPSNKVVITAHGYRGERTQKSINLLTLVARLTEEGYNVLMFDFRNSGESEKGMTGIGCFEQYDLASAIDFVVGEKNQQEVALLGWSMGAATSIVVGATHEHVKVVVADSPFSDLEGYLKENMRVWTKLPNKPFTPIMMYTMEKILKVSPKTMSPINEIKKASNKPFFIIHSKDDEKIPYTHGEKLYEAIPHEQKELWLTKEANHIRSYLLYKEEYEEKVLTFLRTHF